MPSCSSEGWPNCRARAQEGAGDAGADGHLGLVDHLAAAPQLPRHAPHDVLAQLAVVHGLLRVDRRERALVHGDHGLGVASAVERRESEDVAGAVEVRDPVAAEARGDHGLEHAVVDDVEAARVSVGLVEDLPGLERAGREGQAGWHDVGHVGWVRCVECFERVEHRRVLSGRVVRSRVAARARAPARRRLPSDGRRSTTDNATQNIARASSPVYPRFASPTRLLTRFTCPGGRRIALTACSPSPTVDSDLGYTLIIEAMQELPPRQRTVLDRLTSHVARTGETPELSSFARSLGMHYVTLKQHLEALHRKGHLHFESRGRGRSPLLRLPHAATGVPLLGSIPAGSLEAAFAESEGYLTLPGVAAGHFALRVDGRSMADLMQDGDVVLLERREPRPGRDLRGPRRDDDVTLKYLDRPSPERVALRPHNPEYPTVTLHAAAVQVDGVYRGLLRGEAAEALLRHRRAPPGALRAGGAAAGRDPGRTGAGGGDPRP
jgi:repressor LexA